MGEMSAFKDVDLLDGAEEDLVVASIPQQRNWHGVVIALVVIFVMCSLITIAVLILTPLHINGSKRYLKVTLNDVIGLQFLSSIDSIDWIDSHRLVIKQFDSLEIIDLSQESKPNITNIFDIEALYRYGKANFVTMSPDEKQIVLTYSTQKKLQKNLYRIFNRDSLTFENVGPLKTGYENVKVLLFNPTGSDFVYVHNNNIYYQKNASAKNSILITTNGSFDLIHGTTDWLYEEELLQTQQALWWSKDGKYLAFLTIDNRLVNHIEIPVYERRQYPTKVLEAYPKVGVKNLPIASLSIWKKKTGEIRQLILENIDKSLTTYLFSATWIELFNKNVLVAVWANRYQNVTLVTLCTFESSKCVLNFLQNYFFDNFQFWAEPEDAKIKFSTNNSYFLLLPHQRSNENIYTQIAQINVKSDLMNGRETFLPMGNYDVEKIEAVDTNNNLLYFTAAAPNPAQRHLYVTSITTENNQLQEAKCLTCNFSSNCTFHETFIAPISFKKNKNLIYLYLNCKGRGTPHIVFGKIINGTKFYKLFEYGRNKALEKALTTHFLPNVKFDSVLLKNGFISYCKILFPYEISLKKPFSVTKIYPVLVNVYAGPNTQKATEEWLSTTIDVFFSSSEEYIVVLIDGRGSGHRGWRQKQPIYGNLGTVEVEDQIFTIKELLKRYPFMDSNRVGIWGWSYGGFVSAKAVELDNNSTFKCAASIAPVTNFKYYDAAYTERYMGSANSEKYSHTDLSQNISAFQQTSYFLAHGTGDNNVHFQNTAEFSRSLIEGNYQFDLMIYTDESHNLANSRAHIYSKLQSFFKKCFV